MKSLMKKKSRKSSFAYSVLAFLLIFMLSLGIAGWSMLNLFLRERERARQIVSGQADKIQYVMENQLYTTHTVEALLKQGNGKIDNFEQLMAELFEEHSIKNISLIPEGTVTQIYPLEGNEAAMGHNLFTDPERKTEAIAARDSKKLTLSGPFPLKQGGYGVVGRLPIYMAEGHNAETFWGFVGIVLNFPEALNSAQMQHLETQGYTYELWRIHPDTGKRQIIMQSQEPLTQNPQEESFPLPNSTWTLSLAPKDGWLNNYVLFFRCSISLIISVLASLLYKNILELARNRNELDISIHQQASNYQELNQLNEELRIFRHDIKNHMLSLSSLLEKEDISQAKLYMASLSDTLSATHKIVNTENYIFDAILAEKTEIASSKHILVEREVLIGKQLHINNSDWSILFGNALDNAIEACEKVTASPAKITIFIQYTGNILQTRISNTVVEKPLMSQKQLLTTKSDPKNHGLGLKNIQTVVRKYNGVLETSYEDGIFTLSFLLFDV